MRTLSRYWLARFLGLFALVLVTGALILFSVELLIGITRATAESGPAAPGAALGPIATAALRIPSAYASYLVPISVYTSAFLCAMLSARWLELLAAQASGIAVTRTLAPLLLATLLISAAFLYFEETLGMSATRALEQKRAGEATLHFQSGAVWVKRGMVLYSVEAAYPEEGRLEGVRVLERDPTGHLRRMIRAREVRVDHPRNWQFHDALIRSFDTSRRRRPPRVETADRIELAVGGERDLALLAARFESLSLLELSETIAVKRNAGARFHRALAALHGRLANAGAIFALAIVGYALGTLARPSRGYALPAALAVSVLALYYAARVAGATLARTEIVSPAVGTWGVVVLWIVLGAALLTRRAD